MSRTRLFFIALVFTAGRYAAQTEGQSIEKEKAFQLTLVTPLGTNGMESFKTTNKVSLNIFAGASKGVHGVELGGFANIVLKDVKGAQLAGFTNVVLGDVKGAQFAGYFNYSGGNFHGGAFSGFGNVNLGNLTGGQFAGFFNYNHKALRGAQAAGFVNVTLGDLKGAQLAGFANVTAGDVEGLQASGFFNYAKKVKGAQLGLINIADSVSGASIGLLTIVKKGLHQAEVSADELFYANLAVRTGTYKFYNIFSAGATPKSGQFLWQIGYGIGTSFRINDKLRSDLSLSAHHVSSGLLYHATSELYKVYIGMEYKLAPKCFLAAGPTFNLYFGDALLPDYNQTYNRVAPYSMLNETNPEGFNFKGWLGAKVAIRFL